ncbi:hypothetical protein H9P43_001476 [Blastocladiella emersonii ATCC 22665]|nr:hypothetical protein H9P43_001476 [Blastocladiella emersonii ATCC 22665]
MPSLTRLAPLPDLSTCLGSLSLVPVTKAAHTDLMEPEKSVQSEEEETTVLLQDLQHAAAVAKAETDSIAAADDPANTRGFRLVVAVVIGFVNRLRLLLHVHWINFLSSLANPWNYTEKKFFHHIVVAGDDFALGYGDWVIPGSKAGVAQRIVNQLPKLKVLRHQWRTINCGRHGTVSADWLPPSIDKSTAKGALYTRAFLTRGTEEQRGKDAVVLMLGFNDALRGVNGRETAQNVRDIAEHLAEHYGMVIVCTVPNWALDGPRTDDGEPGAMVKALEQTQVCNAVLRAWLKGLDAKTSRIHLGAEPDRANTEYRLSKNYFFDRVHFNSTGYTLLAKDVALAAEKCLRRLEFEEEQSYLR